MPVHFYPKFVTPEKLDAEIRASAIVTKLVGSMANKIEVTIHFGSPLPIPEKAILDGIVSAHIPDTAEEARTARDNKDPMVLLRRRLKRLEDRVTALEP